MNNNQYNDQNNNNTYQNDQYNQNNMYQNNQYNQPQYDNYNQQYQKSYKKKKEADGSGIGGFLGMIVGCAIIACLCYGVYYFIVSYMNSNKTVVCTANGAGYDMSYEFKINEKENKIKSMNITYKINFYDGLSSREQMALTELLMNAGMYEELSGINGVKYSYDGPDFLSSSGLKEYKGKDITFKLSIDRKKANNKDIDDMLSEFDGKDSQTLIKKMTDKSNNPYGLTCYEK